MKDNVQPTDSATEATTDAGSTPTTPIATSTLSISSATSPQSLRTTRSTSTLASLVSQRSQAKSYRPSTTRSPETKFSSLTYGAKDDLGKASICDVESGMRLKRHPNLWLEDGSVICRVEDTLFCVHMSVLARHSVFFRDMFAIPQPVSGLVDSLVLEGVGMRGREQRIPVIVLFDKAEDVANLIEALYDIGTKFGNNDEKDFRTVAGILRLATKYIIDELRDMALDHLTIAWPTTLRAWDLREDYARSFEISSSILEAHPYPHPFEVINLAREVEAPSLLPAAFYDISRYPFSHIFETHEVGPFYRSSERVPATSLSTSDIQRLCVGKELTHQMVTSLIQAMGNGQHIRQTQQHNPHNVLRRLSSGAVCTSAAACRKDFTELVELATQHYLFDRGRGCHDPLYVAEELGQLKSAEISECKACAKSLETWAAREREKIWKMIPFWFRLDPLSENLSISSD